MKNYVVIFILLYLSGLMACSDQGSVTTTEDSNTQPVPVTEKTTTHKLDLSIDTLPSPDKSDNTNSEFSSSQHTLPNLFDKTSKEKQTTVSGGVLREQENEDYMDSINGAEISVEMKIQ